MVNNTYENETIIKKVKVRPLFPKLADENTQTKYGLVYNDCNLFEALEFIAFDNKPICYPDKKSFYKYCPTCDLRQALEYLALNWIPTDLNGEKFNNYCRKYMSDKACEQKEKIEQAICKLEVLIDEKLVKPTLVGKKNTILVTKLPVHIDFDPTSDTFFKLICDNKEYNNAVFNFSELEKAFKDYSEPQAIYKLSIDNNGLYLQINNGEKEKIRTINKKSVGKRHKALDVLTKVMANPGHEFTLNDFDDISSFNSVLGKLFTDKKLKGIKKAFFDYHVKTIKFNGDVTNLIEFSD